MIRRANSSLMAMTASAGRRTIIIRTAAKALRSNQAAPIFSSVVGAAQSNSNAPFSSIAASRKRASTTNTVVSTDEPSSMGSIRSSSPLILSNKSPISRRYASTFPIHEEATRQSLRAGSLAAMIAAAMLTAATTAYAMEEEQEKEKASAAAEESPLAQLKGKTVEELEITLYQYETCPFCCKLKAYLDYYKIPYRIVEVNPLTKAEIKFSSYKKVPILMVNGIQVNDSSKIITALYELLQAPNDTRTQEEKDEEARWRQWVDDKLIHMLAPNIYRTQSEALQAFNYITEQADFNYIQRLGAMWGGSTAMYFISKNLKRKYNIVDERQSLYECGHEWVKALNNRDFMGGDKPNLADLAAYGVLSAIEGLDAFRDMRQNTPIGAWYDRMKHQVGKTSRLNNFRKAQKNSISVA